MMINFLQRINYFNLLLIFITNLKSIEMFNVAILDKKTDMINSAYFKIKSKREIVESPLKIYIKMAINSYKNVMYPHYMI